MKTGKPEPRDTALSDLQYHVMQALWAREESSAADVQAYLAEENRSLALTTVATLLSRLARRGLTEARREGRQVFYRPCVSEREVKRSMVSDLLGTLFAGDPKALVTHLVRESELDRDDIATLKTLLANSEKEHKSS